jgi:hypothetical protein
MLCKSPFLAEGLHKQKIQFICIIIVSEACISSTNILQCMKIVKLVTIFDHNSAPQPFPKIKIAYHPNGNIKEFKYVMPPVQNDQSKNNPHNCLSLKRLDYGYEEEETLLSKVNLSKIKEDTVNPDTKDELMDANAIQNIASSSQKPASLTSILFWLDGAKEKMLERREHNK